MNKKRAETARQGLVRKTAELKATWLRCYDPAISLIENSDRAGISVSAYFVWLKADASFAEAIKQRKALLTEHRVSALENTSFKAANGGITTVKKIYDGEGNLKELHEVQQPPSYKHAELLLKAHAPDVYKPDSSGAQVSININLSHADGQGEEVSYIDITDDPGKGM